MDEVARVIMFFFKAEAIVLAVYFLWVLHDTIKPDNIAALIGVKADLDALYGFTYIAILATFVYAWCI